MTCRHEFEVEAGSLLFDAHGNNPFIEHRPGGVLELIDLLPIETLNEYRGKPGKWRFLVEFTPEAP